ncbi:MULTISPECIES: hypothetical protein [Bacillus]|uniref:NAD(P)-dependent dehydrogenase (Short-subunit alcohol dehydrogenase family) n=1 Tax=Bacillus capparidis TaxID=1840411 RepID=A0ABS4CZK8_9BACI|nr:MULTISPECIES: hypothetical protein [Bacillus]MBP1082826.1 NAD(P)-dependent dehydrogenase (short-subunit alcohol dehydrogenase family) [Bacillus capparidis]MED1098467.1 hypothetical protein [Bacillus capparidis]
MLKKSEEKVAIVTGGSREIGQKIVRNGVSVIVNFKPQLNRLSMSLSPKSKARVRPP